LIVQFIYLLVVRCEKIYTWKYIFYFWSICFR